MTARSRHGGELAVGMCDGTESARRRARSLRGGAHGVGTGESLRSVGRRACGLRGGGHGVGGEFAAFAGDGWHLRRDALGICDLRHLR